MGSAENGQINGQHPTSTREKLPLLPFKKLELAGEFSFDERKGKPRKSQLFAENGEDQHNDHDTATVNQTGLNIAKLCMGSGTLALPFGASQGGLLFNIFGLAGITYWNLYSVDRLLKCLDLIPDHHQKNDQLATNAIIIESCNGHTRTRLAMERLEGMEDIELDKGRMAIAPPPPGTATLGRVAWYALGPLGLHALDFATLLLMLGIIISYQDAVVGFIGDTPLTTDSKALDSLFTVLIIAPLSSVREMKYLAKFSAMGIFTLFFSFAAVAAYGVAQNSFDGFGMITWGKLWPESISAASNWFGIMVFGFGNVPFTYNLQESMKEPHLVTKATEMALFVIFVSYAIISDGLEIIYQPTLHGFKGDVLEVLPVTWVPVMVRLSMTLVILVTTPLIVVPCGELIEGRIGTDSFVSTVIVRVTICVFCTVFSLMVPGFVHVISFIGCFFVTLVSFVFPPLFHMILIRRKLLDSEPANNGDKDKQTTNHDEQLRTIFIDKVLLTWGVIATVISSVFTFKTILES